MAEPADELLAELIRWAGGQKVAEAAAGRSRTRSLRGQLASGATWEGILVDLAEERRSVEVTVGVTRLSGRIVGLGKDFLVLEVAGAGPALVRTSAISSLAPSERLEPGAARRSVTPGGDRRPGLSIDLGDALEALVAEVAPLRIVGARADVEGVAVALGADVLTLRRHRPGDSVVHVPLGSVWACQLR